MEQLHEPSGATCINEMVTHGQLYIDESHLHGRHETIHVVASVAVVAEQQLVVVFAGPAQCAGLALDALPGILLN